MIFYPKTVKNVPKQCKIIADFFFLDNICYTESEQYALAFKSSLLIYAPILYK